MSRPGDRGRIHASAVTLPRGWCSPSRPRLTVATLRPDGDAADEEEEEELEGEEGAEEGAEGAEDGEAGGETSGDAAASGDGD